MTSLQIHYFLTVAQHLSFSRAAAELFITQPSLSKQIASFEHELGLTLFDRSVKSRIRLTPAGERMYAFFTRFRSDFQTVLQEAQDMSGTLSGSVHIGVTEALDVIREIAPLLRDWAERFPEVSITFERQPLEKLNEELMNSTYDLILQLEIMVEDSPGMDHRRLTNEHGIFIFSSQNPYLQKEPLEPYDFRNEPFFVLDAPGTQVTHKKDLDYCASVGFTPVLIPMPNGDSIVHAISAGRGFGLFHPWTWYKNSPDYRWIETGEPIPLSIAWRKNTKRELTLLLRDDIIRFFTA